VHHWRRYLFGRKNRPEGVYLFEKLERKFGKIKEKDLIIQDLKLKIFLSKPEQATK
jgi:hypothetical protein